VIELDTPRLRLRAWRDSDLEPFAALNADPEVTRYVTGPLTREHSNQLAIRIRAGWDEHGFGLWAAELRDETRTIGFIGLSVPAFLPAVLPAVEVGWRLARDVWGRGLASEGGRASLDHAFGTLRLERVVSIIHPENAASRRVAEKLGMRLHGRLPHDCPGGLVCVYECFRPASAA
jgi:RimJ/RimL family protein N-acetyltransferase